MRLAASALVTGLLMTGAAAAQPVATAAGREGELSTAQQIDAWLAEAPPATAASRQGAGPGSPWDDGDTTLTRRVIPMNGPPIARTMVDGQIHGEAGAEISNFGYGGYGVVSGPLGKNAALQIGVSHYEGWGGSDRGRRRWRGPGDGSSTGLTLSAAWAPGQRIPEAPSIYTPATPSN